MKLLICFISPKKIEQVKKMLWDAGIRGVTISQAEGYGYQKVQVASIQGNDYKVQFQPRHRLEIALLDEELFSTINLLMEVLRTGRVGDGKIFVLPLEDAIRVRTGEHGESALS
jgi:nitrogen regulatory protein PII